MIDHILQKFIDILCGSLDNQQQIEEEIKNGKQLHPYAKHVTDVCDHKILNRPKDHEGVYILEESYYRKPGETTIDLKPLLFYLRSDGVSKALLQSVQIPLHLDKAEVTNDNEELKFDWNELSFRQFGVAEYTLHKDGYFTVDHSAELGEGVTFRLVEKLSNEGLEVMEIVHVNGIKVTPYDTSIFYRHIKS